MTLAEFEKILKQGEVLSIETYPTHKEAEIKEIDGYADITTISKNDTIITYEHWFDQLTSFKEMENEIDQFGNWDETTPILMEVTEIDIYSSKDYFMSYNVQKNINSDNPD